MERWLEFHDSEVAAVQTTADIVRVHVDAYIHQWEGAGDLRRGTGWTQRVTFEMEGATTEALSAALPCTIADGCIRLTTCPPKEDGMLPFPAVVDGVCVLELQTVTGEMIRIAGHRLRAMPTGTARFVESLPLTMDPHGKNRASSASSR